MRDLLSFLFAKYPTPLHPSISHPHKIPSIHPHPLPLLHHQATSASSIHPFHPIQVNHSTFTPSPPSPASSKRYQTTTSYLMDDRGTDGRWVMHDGWSVVAVSVNKKDRVYIKFLGIGLCRYRMVLETALTVVIEHIKCVKEYCTWISACTNVQKLFWQMENHQNACPLPSKHWKH